MTNYAIQEQNQDLVSLLAAHFRLLYNPTHAMADAISMLRMFPGLIGLWPGITGTTVNTGFLRDMSGSGLHLTPGVGAVEVVSNQIRYNPYNGTSQYFFATDTPFNSILGTEGTIQASFRGLTALVWIRPSGTPVASEGIIGKWNGATNQRSWLMYRTTTMKGQLIVSNDGTATVAVTTTNDLTSGEWRFFACRYDPSAELKVWESGNGPLNSDVNTTSIPASLFDSNADLAIGATNTDTTPANFGEGDFSIIALCRAAVPDVFINAYYQMTAPLFGISV